MTTTDLTLTPSPLRSVPSSYSLNQFDKMPLSSALKPLFNYRDRNRGASYQRRGAVSSLTVTNGFLIAEVNGSYGFYEVTLDVEDFDNREAMSCTCPRFDDGYLCKHIWATILQYELVNGKNAWNNVGVGHLQKPAKSAKPKQTKQPPAPQWKSLLNRVANIKSVSQYASPVATSPFQTAANQQTEIHYVIDASEDSPYEPTTVKLSVLKRVKKINDQWGKLQAYDLSHRAIGQLANETDQKIAAYLMGADRKYSDVYGHRMARNSFSKFDVDANWTNELCELLLSSGRLHWTLGMSLPVEDFYAIEFIDLSPSAEIRINIHEATHSKQDDVMAASLFRGDELLDQNDVVKITNDGIALLRNGLIRISNPDSVEFWKNVNQSPAIEIAKKDRHEFLKQLSECSGLPKVMLPDSWKVQPTQVDAPCGILQLHQDARFHNELTGKVAFAYAGNQVSLTSSTSAIFDANTNSWLERQPEVEAKLIQELAEFPIKDLTRNIYAAHDLQINRKHLVGIVDELGSKGWEIHLLGKPVKQSQSFDVSVESGQDWFDLSAKVDFEGQTIALPDLLQAIAKKDQFITLADGSSGRIPDEVIEKYARLATFGTVQDDKIRFRPAQAMLLDAMLDAQQVNFDRGFKNFRKKLRSFTGVKPKNAPRGFIGKLREYQSEGLGWLHFLREFRLGGCLADDMGLGKTIQVLSLLESRRTRRITQPDSNDKVQPNQKINSSTDSDSDSKSTIVAAAAKLKRKPSIVIVPKSLIFNWIEEAAKFTPRLKILNYTGTKRQENVRQANDAGGFDVLITTYGTMRRDIADLSQIEFDYAILDESQAIKNSKAQCAKSSRLLRADHRLAMTGTPIENHLGELWSLFEFLNPGMLGASTNFARLTNQKKSNEEEREETLDSLAKAISPFLLRRTKEQVLTDLPPKTEQTLYCDMLPSQKRAYKQLKEYYRVKLAKKVETDGIGRSKIQVLEALLRLRQVACDPRLLDKKAKPGAKLELLAQQIKDIISEGHKVLIFSQFTSFLSLVKQQFDADGISYEYLDGKSSKRAQSVKRFQEDDSVSAFLISIKAGGHGLNLTAADYVFLLDPWWNPAVEAQAIDRAHRMGQQNSVIAYRMICRDTVEEKIVSLQQSKRDLADKIVRSDESLIRSLTADDLKTLFE